MARAQTQTDLIKHRYARSTDGAFVNISDYQPGEVVHCIGCEREMIGRKGKLKQWHFAHKVDLVNSCSIETVLHRLGKALVKEGFEAALATKRPFHLRWPCPRCTTVTTQNIADWCERIEAEGTPTHGVRSDLLLHGRAKCAVEIVVTHDIDEATSKLYAQAMVPVFVVRPTWDTIANLRNEIVADELRFATNTDCPGCRVLDELAKKQNIAAFLERMRSDLEAKPLFRPSMLDAQRWSMRSGQRGEDLEPAIQQTLLDHAKDLTKFGFTPLKRKLILNRHLPSTGNLYAVLRGTLELPISDDPRPYFFLELHAQVIGDQSRLVIREQVREWLKQKGINFRDVHVSPEREQAAYLLPRQ